MTYSENSRSISTYPIYYRRTAEIPFAQTRNTEHFATRWSIRLYRLLTMTAVRYLQITENWTERSPMSREIRKQRDGDGRSTYACVCIRTYMRKYSGTYVCTPIHLCTTL
jgi:hypothetical protein